MHMERTHNYWGVDMEFNDDKMLDVCMMTYLKTMVSEFPELITRKVASPVADHLVTLTA